MLKYMYRFIYEMLFILKQRYKNPHYCITYVFPALQEAINPVRCSFNISFHCKHIYTYEICTDFCFLTTTYTTASKCKLNESFQTFKRKICLKYSCLPGHYNDLLFMWSVDRNEKKFSGWKVRKETKL